MTLQDPEQGNIPAELAHVLITPELRRRPSRPAEFEAESRALASLAEAMTESPQTILQTLIQTILRLFDIDSACVSILESGEAWESFRWHAVGGHLAGCARQAFPTEVTPCRVVLDTDEVLLFRDPERHFTHLATISPKIVEMLLAPFHADGRPVGTVWAISHREDRAFDAEDARLLASVSRFASASYRLRTALETSESHRRAAEDRNRIEEALRQSEQRLHRAMDIGTAGVVFFNSQGTIADANPAFLEMSGYSREELRGGLLPWKEHVPGAAHSGRTIPYEHEFVRKDGTNWHALISCTRLGDDEWAAFIVDLTYSKMAEAKLRASEDRFRLFVENVTDYALLQVDLDARISSWNTGAERTFGYNEHDIVGKPVRELYLPEDAKRGDAEKDLQYARVHGRFEDARWLVRKGGSRFFARWVTTPMRDDLGNLHGYAKVLRDETERRNTEQQLRASLAEKHALLQEIHHRVKNNLQVITSLLSIQAARLDKPEVSTALADTEGRVRAIAALHETLYSSRDLASIEFGPYLKRLVGDLIGFYDVDNKRIDVRVKAADLVLEIGQAIPLGLVVNELVTNAFKHAFPGERSGAVEVELKYLPSSIDMAQGETLDDGFGQLTVRDNGVGLPQGLRFDATPSMGLHLVNVLTEQLQGELQASASNGTVVAVKFPLGGASSVPVSPAAMNQSGSRPSPSPDY